MRFESKELWQEWNSLEYAPQDQFEAWCSALSDSHLKWALNNSSPAQFYGKIKMRHLGGIRLLCCDCEPCYGKRTSREVNLSDGEYYGLLYIYDGAEVVFHEGQAVELKKDSFMIWDSTKPIEFKLFSATKKVTLLVPQDRMRTQLPQVDDYLGKHIDFSRGLHAVAASHIAALGNEVNAIDKRLGDSAIDLTLELITTCLQTNYTSRPMTKVRQDLFDDIVKYIQKNLDQHDLGPSSISGTFHISTRYLHLLFAEKGLSVSHLIMDKRLEQCRRQLIHLNAYKDSITKIAFQWGFNDSAHFSKVFKKKYGITPREYQNRHLNN
ncbi:helix-turn-helix domain-containing protein [Sinanaerobacter chloroacetimidivorans]|uniref:Helix-turn-helix domain-containing protein n=1 Tax=Sinanaerobacter chloroacetimidivorans TaxID=2818044 RepID=A0A8J7VXK8_9FIRM|nr:helix-turn-helix domain-containing protein [Sinanaerobacter chloroacetimidivorans]MBR0596907.1 helix-turn-helix domain-containing protein [Sinanaerobacter chloroacetimidivorans]